MTEFYGFERPDGTVGVRNHLLVLAPIDCSYEPAKKIAAQVEGAVAVTQHHGCRLDEMVANTLIGMPIVVACRFLGRYSRIRQMRSLTNLSATTIKVRSEGSH